MFTLDQINATHAKVKSGADFPQYVQDMKQLGVVAYEMYVTDGHARYVGVGQELRSEPVRPPQFIAVHGDKQALEHALSMHQRGQTDYPTFCRQAAEAGVEKWTTRTVELTCTYYDLQGQVLLVEAIPLPAGQ
ncbi:DUF1398 domain-containing protein [Hymenobacter sp. CRA2]|uniref:DUF1398 domain-containing protein n=1 Tax=Hymenobacter sp. CRA2 TaxID=1955620 RepID=UPI00098E88BB|nr:DUF1398 family protein [Hymenobacter sp. CRA2]OON69946.1 hypothetical protein B0919_04135 [Hymenobacter sp. CRA2]